MEVRRAAVHLFDVDHTIVDASTVTDFLIAAIRRRILPVRLALYVPCYYFRYSISLVGAGNFDAGFPFLRGIRKTELDRLADQVFSSKTQSKINKPVVELMEAARERGERVILASASFKTIVAPLARYLGVDDVIASELEFEDGVSTGRLSTIPAFRDGKRDLVLDFLKSTGAEPGHCVFYSDSVRDLPLLEAVGTAVVVNPKSGMRRIAKRRGWQIVDTGKNKEHLSC
jgi:HAD superfamily hydrolase (TIGR01490 family)